MIKAEENETITLPATGAWQKTEHVFVEQTIWAFNAALLAERPLLVRGEPGCGKSQLARAAAAKLSRRFLPTVVHARSESKDLLYDFDGVARLAKGQLLNHLGCGVGDKEIQAALAPNSFVSPGPLWWAFNREDAQQQADCCGQTDPCKEQDNAAAAGTVLLIDEIDKADADLPNGLLEVLGNGAFNVPILNHTVKVAENSPPPLVVITTNEERELPSAFLRRCLVLHLTLPLAAAEQENRDQQAKASGEEMVFERGPEAVCQLMTAAEKIKGQPGRWHHYQFQSEENVVPILLLSDLGCADPGGQRYHTWLRFGQRAKQQGQRIVVLTPTSPVQWPSALRAVFQLVFWDQQARLPQVVAKAKRPLCQAVPFKKRLSIQQRTTGIIRLLALLSSAASIEPQLLRAIRLLLPADEVDSQTEMAIWQHPEVEAGLTGFALAPQAVTKYQQQFQGESARLREKVTALILGHHRHLPQAVRYEEMLTLCQLNGKPLHQEAVAFFEQAVKILHQLSGNSGCKKFAS